MSWKKHNREPHYNLIIKILCLAVNTVPVLLYGAVQVDHNTSTKNTNSGQNVPNRHMHARGPIYQESILIKQSTTRIIIIVIIQGGVIIKFYYNSPLIITPPCIIIVPMLKNPDLDGSLAKVKEVVKKKIRPKKQLRAKN